jgi:hypothetical protein
MHIVYIDDSKDGKAVCFSALMIPAADWLSALDHLVDMRQAMKKSDGIYVRKELHATDWLGGRGHIAPQAVNRLDRMRLFNFALGEIAKIPNVDIFNACGQGRVEDRLFERLVQRIQNTMAARNSLAIIISDEGKNYDHLLRQMRRVNFIPSAYGQWQNGAYTKNLPAKNLIEDIVYRDSARSYFIQAADFCAFSLLRFEYPTTRAKTLGFDRSFNILKPRLFTRAFAKDPKGLGIIRP